MEKCSPLLARKNTASRNVSKEMTLNTSAWRMKGMSFLMRKNSIAISLLLGSEAGLPDLTNAETFELAATAVDQIDHGAGYDHGTEKRGQDAEAMHHGEAPDRAGTEDQ